MRGRVSTGLAALVSMLWLQIANAITWMTLPVLAPQVAPTLAGIAAILSQVPGPRSQALPGPG